ncbi:MAG: hypothetical protein ABIW33_02675 [Sphingomicrobium sp.]
MEHISNTLLKRSRLLATIVGFVLLLLLFAIAVQALALLQGRVSNPSRLLTQVPALFYLSAVWIVRRAILALGSGRDEESALARMLRNLGIALFLGGSTAVFGVPLMVRFLRGGGAVAYYDPAAITLGVVGLALVLVAQLADRAAAMRRELDEIV